MRSRGCLIPSIIRFSVMVCDDPLYSLHRADLDSDDSSDSDSDDSNAEDNWRNEYPDEEDDVRSIGEEDMRRAVEEIDLGRSEWSNVKPKMP